MRRLTFSQLLLAIILVPVLVSALFAARLAYESWERYRNLTQANSLLHVAVATSRLVGISIPGLGAAGRAYAADGDAAKLAAARTLADTHYRAVGEAAAANTVKDDRLAAQLKMLAERIQQLDGAWAKVKDRTLSANDLSAMLTLPATSGIDLVGRAAAVASDAALARGMFALYATLQFNSGTMVQRGLIQRALEEGQLPPPAFALLARAVTMQTTFAKQFADYAPPEVVRDYLAFSGRSGKTIERLQARALANAGSRPSPAT